MQPVIVKVGFRGPMGDLSDADRQTIAAGIVAAEQSAADRVATGLDAISTASDRTATGLDAAATAADRLATSQDATATASDRDATAQDAAATAADRIQTEADRAATGADVSATAADRLATGQDAAATSADRAAIAAATAATAADRIATAQDADDAEAARVAAVQAAASANTDSIATAADRVSTGEDAAATALDRIATAQDAASTAADRVATGEDRAATAADALATAADRVATGEDRAATTAAAAEVVPQIRAHEAAFGRRRDLIIYDTFQRPDATAPGVSDGGQVWVDNAPLLRTGTIPWVSDISRVQDFRISDNKLIGVGGAGQNRSSFAYIADARLSESRPIEFSITACGQISNSGGVVVRGVDPNNFLALGISQIGRALSLQQMTGGVLSILHQVTDTAFTDRLNVFETSCRIKRFPDRLVIRYRVQAADVLLEGKFEITGSSFEALKDGSKVGLYGAGGGASLYRLAVEKIGATL